jgi:hypothetical protein
MIVVATAILGVTIAFAADMKARAIVTAASLQLRGLPASSQHLTMSTPGAPGNSAGLWVKQKGRGDDEEFFVVAAHDGSNGTQYLLTRGDDTPAWVESANITAWEVKVTKPTGT